ncbi:uncharacterized protein N7473_008318, partial [Penicillium subrubescens]|uniref:uncharacterized protein n=1 Tax=Penicillium subrubescens TaxID=1316194 RepID=UPI00254592B6
MAFHTNSININLRNRHTLSCHCQRPNGSWSYSQLDLNRCLGNNNGDLIWGGDSFAHSATEIRISLEGPDKAPWLHAELNDHDGTHQCAS